MNEKTIHFELTYKEASELDDLYLKNKSLVAQTVVLRELSSNNEHQILYYINTLVEELYAKPEQLDKYLKAIIRQTDMPVVILLNFLKVLYEEHTRISGYEVFRKHCLVVFNKHNVDYDVVLKGFL